MKTIYACLCFIIATNTVLSQKINREAILENGKQLLLGKIDTIGLTATPYKEWYTKNHKDYHVNSAIVSEIKKELAQYKILIFMGIWCGDSKREVPRFIKILEAAEFPMEQLKIVAVDYREGHYKQSPTGEEWGLNIIKVPTFIFLKNGKEVNRIVESPVLSLEEDIKRIISAPPYVANYTYTAEAH